MRHYEIEARKKAITYLAHIGVDMPRNIPYTEVAKKLLFQPEILVGDDLAVKVTTNKDFAAAFLVGIQNRNNYA